MAKRVVETWVSDVISDCEFSSENDMREFDKKLNDREWIVERCKDYIEDYTGDVDINEVNKLADGSFEIVFTVRNLAEYIKNDIRRNCICDTCFHELADLIDYCDDFSDDCDVPIQKHLEKKIDEFADEINALIKFTVAQ